MKIPIFFSLHEFFNNFRKKKFRDFFVIHYMDNMDNEKSLKIPKFFYCKFCDYTTSSYKDYNKHLLTLKHERITKDNEKSQKSPTAKIKHFHCDCGKSYLYSSGLSKHKSKCRTNIIVEDSKIDASLVKELIQQNHELQQQLITMIDSKPDSIVINNQVNNPQLNINMFLNDSCKNAINFTDFINGIEVSQEDLEQNAQLGFVNGITKIFMDNLKQLTLYERPIHCSDVKREVMYIKDNDQWKKDDITVKEKVNQGIQEVSRKSISSLMYWKNENPDYENIDSDFSNKCITIQQHSIAGSKKDIYYPKIMHKIAKESVIINS